MRYYERSGQALLWIEAAERGILVAGGVRIVGRDEAAAWLRASEFWDDGLRVVKGG